MKNLVTTAVILFGTMGSALADNSVTVVSEKPRMVTVYQKVCETREVYVDTHGAQIMGAILGGVVGNRFGGGTGREASTAVGAVLGSEYGRRRDTGRTETREFCHEEPFQVQRGKIVTFEYQGRQFSQILP